VCVARIKGAMVTHRPKIKGLQIDLRGDYIKHLENIITMVVSSNTHNIMLTFKTDFIYHL